MLPFVTTGQMVVLWSWAMSLQHNQGRSNDTGGGGGGGGEDNRNGEIIIAGRTDMGIVGSDTERKKYTKTCGVTTYCA